MFERDGKVLLVGADIDSLTLWHAIEEKLESKLPVNPFTREHFELVSRLADGTTRTTSTRLFEPAVSKRRNLFKLVPELRRMGAWHEARVGGLRVVMLRARDVEAAAETLVQQGIHCYE
jgi:aminoglycoside N3'-acetyltransferase